MIQYQGKSKTEMLLYGLALSDPAPYTPFLARGKGTLPILNEDSSISRGGGYDAQLNVMLKIATKGDIPVL